MRRDVGLVKAAVFIGSCFTKLGRDFEPASLLPNKPPEREQDTLAALEALAATLENQWPSQSPNSEHN